jgi:Lrp/AsnC family transcriptional regulator for asnA, asnC and gidA
MGLTEGAIRKRLKKLTSAKLLKIVGVIDPVKLGYTIDVQIGLHVSPGDARDVAQRLSLLEPVRYVAMVSGSYDIMVAALFQNQDELLDFLTKTVASIPGIIRCETWHMLEVLKRHYDWFPTKESE